MQMKKASWNLHYLVSASSLPNFISSKLQQHLIENFSLFLIPLLTTLPPFKLFPHYYTLKPLPYISGFSYGSTLPLELIFDSLPMNMKKTKESYPKCSDLKQQEFIMLHNFVGCQSR